MRLLEKIFLIVVISLMILLAANISNIHNVYESGKEQTINSVEDSLGLNDWYVN